MRFYAPSHSLWFHCLALLCTHCPAAQARAPTTASAWTCLPPEPTSCRPLLAPTWHSSEWGHTSGVERHRTGSAGGLPAFACSAVPPRPTPPRAHSRRLRTGTSQAVPFVAGVVALILQNSTNTSPHAMSQLLAASAAAGKLSEVSGSAFASWDKVRLGLDGRVWAGCHASWGRRMSAGRTEALLGWSKVSLAPAHACPAMVPPSHSLPLLIPCIRRAAAPTCCSKTR